MISVPVILVLLTTYLAASMNIVNSCFFSRFSAVVDLGSLGAIRSLHFCCWNYFAAATRSRKCSVQLVLDNCLPINLLEGRSGYILRKRAKDRAIEGCVFASVRRRPVTGIRQKSHLLAPKHLSLFDKEMRATAFRFPDRRSNGRTTKQIDFDGPPCVPRER